MATKFSQLPSGGLVQVGAQLVGLDASNVNTRYDFPGAGIRDSNGNMMVGWLPGNPGAAVNYIQLQSAATAGSPVISAVGADASIALSIESKGAGDIYLAAELVAVVSAGGFVLPVGNTAQRPASIVGAQRYNSDTGLMEYYDGLLGMWASIGTGSGSVTAVNGTPNRITSTGGTTPQIDIDVNYVGQPSITTLGTVVAGTWNGATIGVLYGGTGANTFTPYSVICGGTTGSAPLQNVAGVGTPGQVLTSNGAGALPSWQPTGDVASVTGTLNRIDITGTANNPIVNISTSYVGQATITTLGTIATGVWQSTDIDIPYGGTGVSAIPAYSVVCGGITNTSPIQTVSGLGTAGYVLTSNGAAALPTWQVTGNVASITGGTGITVTGTSSVPIVSISATYAGQASIVTVGTITSGTWNGSILTVPYGGTGVASITAYSLVCGGTTGTGNLQTVSSTGTLGQVLTSAGPGALPTWTTPTTGTVSSVTGGTGITVVNSTTTPVVSISVTYAGQASITTLGTIATGMWQGTLIGSQYGGTGVNNGSNTITLGGNLTISGAFATTLTVTGATNVTLPTSGTLAILGNNDFSFSTQYRQQIKDYSETVNVLGNVSGGVTIDLTLGNTITATATGVVTSITVANVPSSGQEASFSLRATNFGAFGITWPTGTQWPGGVTPTLNNAGLSIVVFTTVDGGTTWQAFYPGQSTGSVTSVTASTGLSGGIITASGTIALATNDKNGGRLTLTSGVPVTTTDVTAATTIYFTPFNGNYISLYTSGAWKVYTFSQQSFAVPATTSQMYDVFLYDNAGILTFNIVAWTNDTTRATALAFQDGVYVLSGAAQNRYLGSFRTTSVSGQTEDSIANRFLWNYNNRVTRSMQVIPASNWSYATNTIRQANASTSNQLNMVVGVAENAISATVNANLVSGATNATYAIMIGLDSTTALATNSTSNYCTIASALVGQAETATFVGYVGVGKHSLTWLESAPAAVSVTTVTSASGSYINSGMQGTILG